VGRVMEAYPQVYFACHARHRRDPTTGDALSERQASILDHLDGARPTGMGELADHFGVTAATMSVTVARLVRDGYVGRREGREDRRRVELTLTARGERMKGAMQVLEPDLVGALLRELKPAERRRAIAGLELLATAAQRSYRRRKQALNQAARN
jgi:DNA-binding MarR family transcriptional regulator